jgi:hypothetical protein
MILSRPGRKARSRRRRTSYDQLVKQLLVDFPHDALRFFGGKSGREITSATRITLLRQEQISRRLGRGHRIVDALPLVEWPDGSREARVFLIEQKLRPTRAAIYQVAHYLPDVALWLERDRRLTDIVPVLIFVKDGRVRARIELGPRADRSLIFKCVVTRIAPMSADRALRSGNLAAAANVMSMRCPKSRKVDLCARAIRLWRRRVRDDDLVRKYCEHIFQCARLGRAERTKLERKVRQEEDAAVNTLFDDLMTRGRREGRQEGLKEGLKEGLTKGRAESILELLRSRKLAVSPAEQQRILRWRDMARLRQWLLRAGTVSSAAELFHSH